MAIEKSTIAVIFAGTPHQGSNKAKWASIASKFATILQKDHSSKLSDALKKGSETVESLQDWFKRIEGHFHVFTFIEEVPVYKVGSIVEKEEAAIHCPNEKRRMIHANHMDMVRFGDKTCNEYRKVKDAFRQIHMHQQDIEGGRPRDTRQPPRRLETIRNNSAGAIEGLRPHSFSSQRLLEHEPEHSRASLGRVDTLNAAESLEQLPRYSNDRLQTRGLLGHSLGNLAYRTSTTTLHSNRSGRSDQSAQSDEEHQFTLENDRNKYRKSAT